MIQHKEDLEKGEGDGIASRPVLNTLKQNRPLIYFNKESILKEELQGSEDLEYYLDDTNIYFALLKIYKMNLKWKSLCDITSKVNKLTITKISSDKTVDSNARSVQTDFTSEKGQLAFSEEPAQLIKRLKLDHMQDSDLELSASICIESFDSTPTKVEDNRKRQDEPDEAVPCVEGKDDDNLHADLLSLFWLMSVLPDSAAHSCKRIMNMNQVAWKLDLFDVTMVLLNWGASLESLGLVELESFLNSYSPQLEFPYSSVISSEEDFPSSINVSFVLNAIQQYLAPEMSELERSLLLKALVRVAMDKTQKDNIELFRITLASIVDSFESWNHPVAKSICGTLELSKLPLEHSVFISCSLFDQRTQRFKELRLLICRNLLQYHFRFPEDDDFTTLVSRISSEADFLKKYSPVQLVCLSTLLNGILLQCQNEPPPNFQEGLKSLYSWALAVRLQLLRCSDCTLNTVLRHRLSILTARCSGCLTSS